jgi:hypothetical protein
MARKRLTRFLKTQMPKGYRFSDFSYDRVTKSDRSVADRHEANFWSVFGTASADIAPQ